ncbi:hypothetical protein HanXRQr2_Chr05g0234761 [Helianthus annuus]|uniref:Uncharacterized protein n=1 Tax=Helianthus annuus TaxID=4232 RepID=A0A9K3J2F2_HELAN|nr:hypothetical protein HanXRQr2_Chr05g0234761 [Helianthus annuus]KAJ0924291.1 hypothetical protein HanPSC8_Chr05g0226531 [Helianthus annuus]
MYRYKQMQQKTKPHIFLPAIASMKLKADLESLTCQITFPQIKPN